MAPLTYCSNIHPGESWADVLHNLNTHVLEVKAQLGNNQEPFPLGLRIAAQAAGEIDEAAIKEFQRWCQEHNSYLLTINGFPYGTFHQQRVKEQVYQPDWRQAERAEYSKQLGDIAVRLQPDAKRIAISTVPVAFKPDFDEADWDEVCKYIREVAEHYYQLHQQTGITLILALEPEPLCVLETTEEALAFFSRLDLPERLRHYVGLCFDCCHQAVEFEEPAECLKQIQMAGIPIGKVQVSSALRARGEEIENLFAFDEPVYLHQVVAQHEHTGALSRYPDLSDLRLALDKGERFTECRVHFHIPIFQEHLGQVGTTQFFLREFLPLLPSPIPLEVETYSFSAIPPALRSGSVSDNIARELQWVTDLLQSDCSR